MSDPKGKSKKGILFVLVGFFLSFNITGKAQKAYWWDQFVKAMPQIKIFAKCAVEPNKLDGSNYTS